MFASLATYLFSSACTLSALSLPPCIFGKRAVAPPFLGSLSQPPRGLLCNLRERRTSLLAALANPSHVSGQARIASISGLVRN